MADLFWRVKDLPAIGPQLCCQVRGTLRSAAMHMAVRAIPFLLQAGALISFGRMIEAGPINVAMHVAKVPIVYAYTPDNPEPQRILPGQGGFEFRHADKAISRGVPGVHQNVENKPHKPHGNAENEDAVPLPLTTCMHIETGSEHARYDVLLRAGTTHGPSGDRIAWAEREPLNPVAPGHWPSNRRGPLVWRSNAACSLFPAIGARDGHASRPRPRRQGAYISMRTSTHTCRTYMPLRTSTHARARDRILVYVSRVCQHVDPRL